MAIENIRLFHTHFSEAFDQRPFPPWHEDWRVIHIADPESNFPQELQDLPLQETVFDQAPNWIGRAEASVPPALPALAFYLPFHYYDYQEPAPRWGIYVVHPRMQQLSQYLLQKAGGVLTPDDTDSVCHLFLYGAQVFHHRTESFATRLEVTHRQPLYKVWFETHRPLEEALAAAAGYRKILPAFKHTKPKQAVIRQVLKDYIRTLLPGYQQGVDYLSESKSAAGCRQFAEEMHHAIFPQLPVKPPTFWALFPYAFRQIGTVRTPMNYLVPSSYNLQDRTPMPRPSRP